MVLDPARRVARIGNLLMRVPAPREVVAGCKLAVVLTSVFVFYSWHKYAVLGGVGDELSFITEEGELKALNQRIPTLRQDTFAATYCNAMCAHIAARIISE